MCSNVIIHNPFKHGDTIYGEEKHLALADINWTFAQLYWESILLQNNSYLQNT